MTATDEARARELLLHAERLHEMEGSDFAIAAVAQALEAVRREALEEAAKVAESTTEQYQNRATTIGRVGKVIASRIRALLPATKEGPK